MNWRVTGPANGHRTASPPVGIPSSMQAPMQSRPSKGVLRENFLRDIHDPANGRRLSSHSLRVSACGVESKHGEPISFLDNIEVRPTMRARGGS